MTSLRSTAPKTGAPLLLLTLVVVVLLSTTTATAEAQTTTTTIAAGGNGGGGGCPKLIWNDEFDGTSLDETKWTPMIGNGCDLGEGMCGWGNNEWQYYTGVDAPEQNIEVSDGTLKIHAKYDGNQYTSARIRSLGKGDFDLSAGSKRMEARIKVPQGEGSYGLWPAFWMMPSEVALNQWPTGGEIDIMEYIGKEPNTTYGVMHYGHAWNDKSQKGGVVKFPEPAGEQFHVFAVEKTPHTLTWLVDHQPYMTYTQQDVEPKFTWPFDQGMFHFILNLAIGGNWPEYPDATTVFPNTLEVDYVRVYDLSSSVGDGEDDASSRQEDPMTTSTTKAAVVTPMITGESLVRRDQQEVQYCVAEMVEGSLLRQTTMDYDTYVYWKVPPEATIIEDSPSDTPAESFRSNNNHCIRVNFGSQSGYIQADIYFNTCSHHYEVKVPVHVEDYYRTEFAFVAPDFYLDEASYMSSTGDYTVVEKNDKTAADDVPTTLSPPYIVYQRNPLEVYDYISLDTKNSILNPNLYVQAASKLYLDAWSKTAAPCTRIWIQFEDSNVATPTNYPQGRHSRYMALLPKDDQDENWQRLEFDYYDQPDFDSTQVDRLVILIDSFGQRSDTYYLRNLVSAQAVDASSCSGNSTAAVDDCQPLRSNNQCQIPAKSEAGACTDGINNDGIGWNGDQPMDCDDSDCYGIDPACPIVVGGGDGDDEPDVDTTTTTQEEQESSPPPKDDADATTIGNGSSSGSSSNAAITQPEEPPLVLDETSITTPLQQSQQQEPSPPAFLTATLTASSCSIHPECVEEGLMEGDCCPSSNGNQMSCCSPDLCISNPKCIGLEGPTCCPTPEGVYLECCENRPQSCKAHTKCSTNFKALLRGDDCCPNSNNEEFLDCCEPSECSHHPVCQELGLIDECCPTSDGIYLDCCNLDLPNFAGFTSVVVQSSVSEAPPPPALDEVITVSTSEVLKKTTSISEIRGGAGAGAARDIQQQNPNKKKETTVVVVSAAYQHADNEVAEPSVISAIASSGSGLTGMDDGGSNFHCIGWLLLSFVLGI